MNNNDLTILLAEQLFALKHRNAALIATERTGSEAEAENALDAAGRYLKAGVYADNPGAVDYLVTNAKACLPIFR